MAKQDTGGSSGVGTRSIKNADVIMVPEGNFTGTNHSGAQDVISGKKSDIFPDRTDQRVRSFSDPTPA